MIVPASYEKQVLKIPVNAISTTLSFAESGVYVLNTCWEGSANDAQGVYYSMNGEKLREESFYTVADVETLSSAFMHSFQSGDSIQISTFKNTTLIKYVMIWKAGNYVENS